MGQFRSPCPKCNRNYYWFLEAEDHNCEECGEPMTAKQAEEIWHKVYSDHIDQIGLSYGGHTFTREEVENTPWDKLPNVYFSNVEDNSREQHLRMAKTNYYKVRGDITPSTYFMPKATWDDMLALENKKEDDK